MRDEVSGRAGVLVVIALGVWAVLLITAAQSTLWDRDEPRYATAALEMASSGNLLYPTFNHELRPFQPVMVYWLMAAGIRTFGPCEVGVRFASTVAIAVVCLLTGLLAREFLRTGAAAAAIAGTSPMLLLTGTSATTDATLLLFILVAEWVFVRAWLDGPRRWHVPVMGLAIGMAMLTKGPVGLAVPVLSIGTCLALSRGRSNTGPWAGGLVVASFIGLAIFLAWGLPANAATGGEYWRIAITERLPRRLFTAMEGHGGQGLLPFLLHLPYYPLVLAVGFLPWTMYLVLVPGSFGKRLLPVPGWAWARSPEGLRVLLVGMILPTLVLMTLVVSKLPHYIQPVFPWFAILVASALEAARSGAFSAEAARRMRRVYGIVGVPCFFAAWAIMVIPWVWPPACAFRLAGAVTGVILLALLAALARCYRRNRFQTALNIHAVGMMALLLACAFFVMPPLERLAKPAQWLAREIQPKIPAAALIAAYGWHEPAMHFYLGAPKILHIKDADALKTWLAGPGPRVLILEESSAPGLPMPPEGFRILSVRTGLDNVHGRSLRLAAFLRD